MQNSFEAAHTATETSVGIAQLLKGTPKKKKDLSGISIALCSEFYTKTLDEDVAKVENFVYQRLSEYVCPRTVEMDMGVFGTFGLEENFKSDFSIINSALDDEDFGENSHERCDFFNIVSQAKPADEINKDMILVTDFLTSDDFHTNEYTDLAIMVEKSKIEGKLSPLALALNCDDLTWMQRSGRPLGRYADSNFWTATLLSEIIAKRVLQDADIDLDENTPISEWVVTLENVAHTVVAEETDCVTMINPNMQSVVFNHMGGRDYYDDFGEVVDITKEMAYAVKKSCIDIKGNSFFDYWHEPRISNRLKAFIDLILEIKKFSQEIDYEKVTGSNLVSYHLTKDDEHIGKISCMNSKDHTDVSFDDSLITIGNVSDYVRNGDHAFITAAVLHFKNTQRFS